MGCGIPPGLTTGVWDPPTSLANGNLAGAAMQPPETRCVFEAAQDPALLRGLCLVHGAPPDAPPARAAEAPANGERPRGAAEVSDRMCCSACAQAFDSREEQTEHYRLDWHRFNLKQRLRGRRALTAEEFEDRTGAGDVSSISGSGSGSSSDSSSDSDVSPPRGGRPEPPQGRRSHKVLFRNAQGQLLAAYRCVLSAAQGRSEEPEDLVAALRGLSPDTCWVVLMLGGGHFAGAVFRGSQVLEHKTFHRYTVRARRGTAQGLRDAQAPGCIPRSAGASLRRYNEAALLKDIQELLASWEPHLQGAQRIFLRAPRAARALLLGGRSPLLPRASPHVYHVPLSTRRATFREVQRVHSALATLQVYGKDTSAADLTSSPRKAWRKVPRAGVEQEEAPQAPSEEEDEDADAEGGSLSGELETVEVTLGTLALREFEVMPRRRRRRKRKGQRMAGGSEPCSEEPGGADGPEASQQQPNPSVEPGSQGGGAAFTELRDALFTACKTGDAETLRLLLGAPVCASEQPGGPALLALLSAPIHAGGFTLLHVAAAAGRGEAVRLLLEAGADPTVRDGREKPPYCVCADKPTRSAFRRFAGEQPDRYDYAQAQVPAPLRPEVEAQQLERRRAQQVRRRQREQVRRDEQRRQEQEEEEKRRFAALPERDKRALAAERRLAAQLQESSTALANCRRCWQCGESLLGRVPFHYLDGAFCSTACLQAHRRARAGPH
ncbi:tRNA endonuclease ANKZF1 isoform X1 [Alligator mississippiensis]|uniref:tRNA endonuclease ANKZF1 isoform X1 n=2 Tax=Alligator mississippiensis TaxID=8496 RepID=UPI0028780A36|nr:tRNA endonuclease ANKZF1 isoform X1 [Alligator mississippiensis]